MGRGPAETGLKKGAWTVDEDQKLVAFIEKNQGHGNWRTLPRLAGLQRCGKSCRLRWTNYLRPDIKRGNFSPEEERTITQLHALMGNRWSAIASHLPGRTDNEVKNHWHTHLKKRLRRTITDPTTHRPLLRPAAGHQIARLLLEGNRLNGTPTPNIPATHVQNSGPARRPLDKFFVSHMAQWELARLEAETRLSGNSFSSTKAPPQPVLIALEPGSADDGLCISSGSSKDCSSSSGNNVSGTTSCRSPEMGAVDIRVELDALACYNVSLEDIFDRGGLTARGKKVDASMLVPPKLLQTVEDENELLQVVHVAVGGRITTSSCSWLEDDTAAAIVPTPEEMAAVLFDDLQLDAMTCCGPAAPFLEDLLIIPGSPGQACLLSSTSLDYLGLATLLPPAVLAD